MICLISKRVENVYAIVINKNDYMFMRNYEVVTDSTGHNECGYNI